MRRLAVFVAILCGVAACGAADSYPAKPVRWLVPFPPGGGTDLISRTVAAKLGAITFGSPGNGTIGHLSMELLKSMARVDMLHIPYTGASRAITELIGGQIVVYSSSMPPAVRVVRLRTCRAARTARGSMRRRPSGNR